MIYVLGSINMDLVFTVPYMPRAGETLSSLGFATFCGGKGANQAAAIGKLGGKVKMAGVVGEDGYGKELIENLKRYNVDTKFVRAVGPDSGLAAILIEKGNNRIILNSGANGRVTKEFVDAVLSDARAGDIFLTQLEIPLDVVAYALEAAKAKGMTTVLNPAPASEAFDKSALKFVDIITPNETETQILTGIDPQDIVHITLAVKKFYSYGVKNVIITLGEKGAAVAEGQTITEIPSKKVKVVDTTAAGDTFVGAALCKLAEGAALTDACRFATCASSITVQREGASVSIPTIEEVEKIYGKDF